MKSIESTQRFTGRADAYNTRPKYPQPAIDYIVNRTRINTETVIADIGAGTGMLAEHFVRLKSRVYGVEPNQDMRARAEHRMWTRTNFVSVDGSAEATTLPAESVDVITVGQALHWFDLERARVEFRRILRKAGLVVPIWNSRKASSAFGEELERLMERHRKEPERDTGKEDNIVNDFFAGREIRKTEFETRQVLSLEELQMRVASISVMPLPEEPEYKELMGKLEELHRRLNVGTTVTIHYSTKVYIGQLE
ncbi:class I SAM-dependent methyltransferase [Candidatus Micrarchaeota archaeon]|nr:class I SAM-dependent methyltransferase [Candidatus Micrarchaeota archaeon]